MARHRLPARQSHRSRHSGNHEVVRDSGDVVAGRVGQPAPTKVDRAGQRDKHLPYVVDIDRAPVNLRATIQRYWADGLDAQDIADRLSGYGVTIHNVMVERYLH